MTTTEMRAGHGTLSRAATLVAEAKVDLDHCATTLQNRLVSAQSRWQGAGGSAFFAVQQAWSDKQRAIVAALDDFQAALTQTESLNEATDQAAMSLSNAHLNRLDGIRR